MIETGKVNIIISKVFGFLLAAVLTVLALMVSFVSVFLSPSVIKKEFRRAGADLTLVEEIKDECFGYMTEFADYGVNPEEFLDTVLLPDEALEHTSDIYTAILKKETPAINTDALRLRVKTEIERIFNAEAMTSEDRKATIEYVPEIVEYIDSHYTPAITRSIMAKEVYPRLVKLSSAIYTVIVVCAAAALVLIMLILVNTKKNKRNYFNLIHGISASTVFLALLIILENAFNILKRNSLGDESAYDFVVAMGKEFLTCIGFVCIAFAVIVLMLIAFKPKKLDVLPSKREKFSDLEIGSINLDKIKNDNTVD